MSIADNLLIATVGLPRSGKTTLCRIVSDRKGWPIVSPDAVRMATHGGRFDPDKEPQVWRDVYILVSSLFLAGTNRVLVDACNIRRSRRDFWLCGPNLPVRWTVAFHPIETPAEECKRRALAEEDEEIIPVIDRMHEEFEPLSDTDRTYDLSRHT